jgi:peptidoglycan/LPS O-acetylase OafA/YrhL
MLLAEMHSAKFPAASPWMAVLAIPLSAAVVLDSRAPGWLTSVVLATSFTLLCSAAFFSDGWLYRILSLSALRWLGNISYSFYLLHGFVVVLALRILFSVAPQNMSEVIFWAALPAVFLLAFGVAACLFLAIEKPISLKSREAAAIASPEPVAS